MLSVCVTEPVVVKLGMNIMPTKPILMVYFTYPFPQSVCLYAYPSVSAKQWFSINVTTAMNTHARTDKLLETTLSKLCHTKESID